MLDIADPLVSSLLGLPYPSISLIPATSPPISTWSQPATRQLCALARHRLNSNTLPYRISFTPSGRYFRPTPPLSPPASAALQKAGPASQAAKAAAALATPPQGLLTLSIRSGSDQPAPLPPTPVPPKSVAGPKVGPASTQLQLLGAMASELDTAAARESALLRALARGESARAPSPDEAREIAPERVHVAWAADGLSEAKKASVRLDLVSCTPTSSGRGTASVKWSAMGCQGHRRPARDASMRSPSLVRRVRKHTVGKYWALRTLLTCAACPGL